MESSKLVIIINIIIGKPKKQTNCGENTQQFTGSERNESTGFIMEAIPPRM